MLEECVSDDCHKRMTMKTLPRSKGKGSRTSAFWPASSGFPARASTKGVTAIVWAAAMLCGAAVV
jgi:hypothetical protein